MSIVLLSPHCLANFTLCEATKTVALKSKPWKPTSHKGIQNAREMHPRRTGVMGGMIAVVILALLMVPVLFFVVQRVLARDREKPLEVA